MRTKEESGIQEPVEKIRSRGPYVGKLVLQFLGGQGTAMGPGTPASLDIRGCPSLLGNGGPSELGNDVEPLLCAKHFKYTYVIAFPFCNR